MLVRASAPIGVSSPVRAESSPNQGAACSDAYLRAGTPWVIFLLPLLVWPNATQPFSSPKLAAWSLATFLGIVLSKRVRSDILQPGRRVAMLASLAICAGVSAGFSTRSNVISLLLILTALAWFELLCALQPDRGRIAVAVALSGAVVGAISLMQFSGADPFSFLGWVRASGASPRMRIFATLGNPNFVAAFLVGTLPISLTFLRMRPATRRFTLPAALLWVSALAATGSKAGVLGLLVGALSLLALRPGRFRRRYLAVPVAMGILLMAISASRPLPETVDGRLFIWRVSVPNLKTIPWTGFGPGSFEQVFAVWQADYLAEPAHAGDLRFVSQFNHAHNDGLEFFVDYGWAGLVALAACGTLFAVAAVRKSRASALSASAFAGVIGLAAVAMVDFPLHRPAELFLMVTLMALSLGQRVHRGQQALY